MPTIKYPKNPNIDTAFVEQEDGTKNRALMIAPQDISTLELPNNPNSTKGYITVDGKKQRVILTADITGGGGGGSSLPDQTGHSGEFLTTDGTDASWSDKPLVNTATGTNGIGVVATTSGIRSVVIGGNDNGAGDDVIIGYGASVSNRFATDSVIIGKNSSASGGNNTVVGNNSTASAANAIVVGRNGKATGAGAFQFGAGTNGDAHTVKFFINGQNYKLLDSDGTIPADRLVHAINKYSTMPTAASTNEGWIVQFTGTTDSTYTHGHLYECISDGQNPATYSWTEVQLGGGSSLPSQTGHSGEFLTTDGTDASWAAISALQNTATGTDSLTILGTAATVSNAINIGAGSSINVGNAVAIGKSSSAGNRCVAVGHRTQATNGIAIGANMICSASGSVLIGTAVDFDQKTNSTMNTFKWANNNGVYELFSADGTIPAARHASLPAADGTYTLQLVIADGVPTLSWVAV